MPIPKQMLTAMRDDDRFAHKSVKEIEAIAAGMSLGALANLAGVAQKLVILYATNSGRVGELYETGWPLDDETWITAARAFFLDDLERDYESPTANDRANLRQLAFFMAMREKLSRELVRVADNPDSDSMDMGRASRALATVQVQILELEKHLEIDPAARAATALQDGGASAISDLVEAFAEYVQEEGVIHLTDHGPAGYTFWYFKDHAYMPTCAHCGGRDLVFASPYNEGLPSESKRYPFVVATPEQMERYVFAGDFIPDGAPALPIFEELNGAQTES